MASTSTSSAEHVRVLGTSYLPLRHPPPPHLEQIPLSFLDAWFLSQPPIQRLFLYDGSLADFPPRPLTQVLARRRSRRVLPPRREALLRPLHRRRRRRLLAVHRRRRRPVHGGRGQRRLSGEARHGVPAFLGLVPSLETPELPAPVLAVQATRFEGGGVVVGVAMHHAVADGHSFWRFMAAWSPAARYGALSAAALAPTFEPSAIVHPTAAEMTRGILRAPEGDTGTTAASDGKFVEAYVAAARDETTTVELGRRRIDHIKNRIAAAQAHPQPRRPSTFVAVAAVVWSCVVRARSLDAGARTRLLVFLADCHPRLDPPVHEGYFGNGVLGCVAEANPGDLIDGGMSRAARAIPEAVDEFVARPLAGGDTWSTRWAACSGSRGSWR
ncbi:hypothetical protein ACP4OV_021041 [Aristida adscensionis]